MLAGRCSFVKRRDNQQQQLGMDSLVNGLVSQDSIDLRWHYLAKPTFRLLDEFAS
jgi:hypothetical protein